MKKAVSPLISVMLVLVFTVSISTVMLNWVTDYTKTTTQAATQTATGSKGITYCANSNVEISNVVLKNQQIVTNTSVSSGDINYFDISSIARPIITFIGRSTSIPITDNFDNEDSISSSTNIFVSNGVVKLSIGTSTINTWTTDDDWNGGTHTNTSTESDSLGMCWDGGIYCNWDNRKPINVSSTSNLTDYQVNLSVTWNSKMQDNFEDIRYTYYNATTDTETELPYWIESNTAQTNALVWFKTNLTSGDNTVYMYYGNSDAISVSDGNNVFVLWSQFNSSLTTDAGTWVWSILEGPACCKISNEMSFDNTNYFESGGSLWQHTETTHNWLNNNVELFDNTLNNSTESVIVRIYGKGEIYAATQASSWQNGYIYVTVDDDVNSITKIFATIMSSINYGGTYYQFGTHPDVTGSIIGGDNEMWYYVDLLLDNTWDYSNIDVLLFSRSGSGDSKPLYYTKVYWDVVMIRNSVTTPPTTSFGAEQTSPTSGQYTSNTTTLETISRIKATWNATEPNANVNITVDISADNGSSWCMGIVNNTDYISCGGLGIGTELNFRVNFNTNGTETALLHDITINYSTQQISGELISKNMTLNPVLLSWTGTKLENITMYVSDDNTTWVGPISNDYTTNSSWDALYYKAVFVYDGTSPELDFVTVMRGDVLTQNPKASINGNANITHIGTLNAGQTATLTINQDNFIIGQNNITIYTDSGVVDYSICMNCLSAIVSNTGMNNVTVKQVIAFKTDGTNCILQNNETTFDVGDVFTVSGCPMSCNEFTSIKAYTDCTGVQGLFSGTPSGC